MTCASVVLVACLGCRDRAGDERAEDDTADNDHQCFQGTFSVAASANGAGYPYADGTAVTATIGLARPQTVGTTIEGGGFSVSLYEDNPTCNLGATATAPVALYIDANADGVCTLADDVLMVWMATSGPWGPSTPGNDVELSPATGTCPTVFELSYYHWEVDRVRDVARRLCPEIQNCLPVCRPPDPPDQNLPGRFGGFCGKDPSTADAGLP